MRYRVHFDLSQASYQLPLSSTISLQTKLEQFAVFFFSVIAVKRQTVGQIHFLEPIMHCRRYVGSEHLEMHVVYTSNKGLIDGILSRVLVFCSLLTAIY
jgi:hypothetical protein